MEDKLAFEPVVSGLSEVAVVSGEEEEDTVFKTRARLFRYAREADPPCWKERGIGEVRKTNNKTRKDCVHTPIKLTKFFFFFFFFFIGPISETQGEQEDSHRHEKRQDIEGKKKKKYRQKGNIQFFFFSFQICANHYISPIMVLTPNVGSDRSWVWQCPADFSEADGVRKKKEMIVFFFCSDEGKKKKKKPTEETLAIRVKNAEHAAEFKAAFERCARINGLIHEGNKPEELAAALDELKVVEAGVGETPQEEESDVKRDDDDDDEGGDD